MERVVTSCKEHFSLKVLLLLVLGIWLWIKIHFCFPNFRNDIEKSPFHRSPSWSCCASAFSSVPIVLLVSYIIVTNLPQKPLLKLLCMSFWAETELPHLIVTELVQVRVHLRGVQQYNSLHCKHFKTSIVYKSCAFKKPATCLWSTSLSSLSAQGWHPWYKKT